MDRHSERVETDSTVDNTVGNLDTTDLDVEIRAHARDRNASQFLAGNAEAVAVGLRTDADTHQAADQNVGHIAVGFAPRGDPAATPPGAAFQVSADRRETIHSTPHPTGVAYYGPHPSASGAAYACQSSAEVSWDVLWAQAHLGRWSREQSREIGVKSLLRQRVPGQIQPQLLLPRM